MSTYQGAPDGARSPATTGPYCLARCYCGTCPQHPEQMRQVQQLRAAEYEQRLRREFDRVSRTHRRGAA